MNGANTPTLETERLILRRFTEEDIPELYAIFHDPEVTRFVPWHLETLDEAQTFYTQRYELIYRQPLGCAYAVCLKDSGKVIGYVNTNMEPPYDFGYGYKKEVWGQGYVSEAARAVSAWLKETSLPYITATHDVAPHSGWVMRAMGMTYRYTYHENWQDGRWVWFRMYQLELNGEHATYRGYWDKYPEHMVEKIEEMRDEN